MARVYANMLKSTWLDSADYDPETQELNVRTTSGQTYTFQKVPQEIFEGLRDAPSAGAYYHTKIKGVHG